MNERGVARIEMPDHEWFLDAVALRFRNKRSFESKEGDIDALIKPGAVFNEMNPVINPFFGTAPEEAAIQTELGQAEELRAGLEGDLQMALRGNIRQLEEVLSIIDGGSERSVDAGRIDITANDSQGRIVIIELKAGRAEPESVAQILAYMASVQSEQQSPIRGILVAFDFADRVVLAAKAVPNLQFKQYSFRFTFKDR